MNTYKITNITNSLGKREFKFNSTLDIDYVDNMTKKTLKVKPGESVYLTIQSLPLSVHRLRVKKLVIVSEVGEKELANSLNESKPKVKMTNTVEETEAKAEKKSKSTGKKTTAKKNFY